ncbi:MAG: hypothetical protein R6V17_03680 [Halanaerobacter sp.]
MNKNKKTFNLTNELMGYFFDLGIEDIQIKINNNHDDVKISIWGVIEDFSLKQIEDLELSLNTPRETQVEGYYFELTGNSSHIHELPLVGMMTDKAEVKYEDDQLEITVQRRD